MNILQLFPTLVFTKTCELNLIDLYNRIIEFKDINDGIVISNRGGYQSQEFKYQPLEDVIKDSIPLKEGKPINNIEVKFWFNINKKGDYNDVHDHDSYSGTFLSGVFYVSTPENCGRIRLYDPRCFVIGAPDMKYYYDSNNYHYFNPEPNLLIMFPGWLKHDVEPNQSTDNRVSVAFNVFLR